jgi:hypothetical protein
VGCLKGRVAAASRRFPVKVGAAGLRTMTDIAGERRAPDARRQHDGAVVERRAELALPERLQIMLTEDEVKALDDWRFAKRMPSRASASRLWARRALPNR